MLLTDILIFYMVVGYAVNNSFALITLYSEGDYVEIDFVKLILTIPVWPLTVYQTIAAVFSKDD
jgi:hypothetical protein